MNINSQPQAHDSHPQIQIATAYPIQNAMQPLRLWSTNIFECLKDEETWLVQRIF